MKSVDNKKSADDLKSGDDLKGSDELKSGDRNEHKGVDRLVEILRRDLPWPLGVAFSGGVDSATLLALCKRALGDDGVVALLGVSASLPASERRAAASVASGLGVSLVEVPTSELHRPEYRQNGPDRCYHCKSELFARIAEGVMERLGLAAIAYGENADDVRRKDRPGARAAAEYGVLRPLADLGLTKQEVRQVARHLHLPVWDKPAAPCLASRIPHFAEVSAAKLHRIEIAEEALRSLGFRELRVRHHGRLARVELGTAELARVTEAHVRHAVIEAVAAAGFEEVVIDPAGLRSGAFTLSVVDRRD